MIRGICIVMLLTAMAVRPAMAHELRNLLDEEELTVCVHRAAINPEITENSLSGMEIARDSGFIMHEVDLRESADGRVFLMHDETLDRTTTASGAVSDYTADELTGVRLKSSDEPVPSLPEVLTWARENDILLMLDVKDTSLDKIYEDVRRAEMTNRVFLLTFSEEQSIEALRLDPRLMVSVLINDPEDIQKYREHARSEEQLMAYINRRADPKLFEKVRNSGIPVITDTLREIDRRATEEGPRVYREFIDKRKPDIVVSDFPIEVRKVLP